MSKMAYEITDTTTPTSATTGAAGHHHLETTNETLREEKYPSLGVIYTVQTHCTGNGNKIFEPRHSTICTAVHDLHQRIHKNKIVPLPRHTKKPSL